MKEHVDRLFGKLRSSKGETLAELLVSVLVIVLGLTMFATAMMSSKKMLVKRRCCDAGLLHPEEYPGRGRDKG